MAVPRTSLIRFRIRSPAAKKYLSTPMFACTAVPSDRSGRYAPGAHMKYPPKLWMLFENLMFVNVSAIQSSFLISGSEASPGPANVSLVHENDAPMKPSKIVPTVLLRFSSTPQAFREPGSVLVYG